MSWHPRAIMTNACETGSGVASAVVESSSVAAVGRVSERWRYRGEHPLSQPRRSALGKLGVFSDPSSVVPEGPGGSMEMLEKSSYFQEVPDSMLKEEIWRGISLR
eukprot:1148129-Pyramimonas_sp.AAC.1